MKKRMLGLALALFLLVCGCAKKTESHFSPEQLNQNQTITVDIQENSLSAEGLVLEIGNHTERERTMDMTYALEKKEGETWYLLNGEQAFESLAQILPANTSVTFAVHFENELSAGEYRIIKPVGEDNLAQTFELP